MKLRINAKNKDATTNAQGDAVAKAYGNKFIIPLDFEMLDSSITCYQSGLGNRLCYEITFNNYRKVIIASGHATTPDAKYEIKDIALEYEIVIQQDLSSSISTEYQNKALQCDRILRYRQIPVNKSDTTRNWSFNISCRLLKGILVLLEEEQPYIRDVSKFTIQRYKKSMSL